MTGQPDSSWLQERLFERRIVLCRGVLDDALAGRVAAELMTLDALGDGAIELQFDSQATALEPAWTLIDVIDLLGVPVNIVCSGRVEGASVGVLCAGARRTALAHTRFRLSDPELEISGRANELTALLDHHSRRLDRLHERVAASTGRPLSEVAADFRAGRLLDATESIRYRLIDEIAGDRAPIRSIGDPRHHAVHTKRSPIGTPIGFKPDPPRSAPS
ncbi:MAG: ATP-dependent Clp protease proteolytic subunit [Acidimicrobiales bacterium]|jgi:ATP-dependent Clp protease protease subunit